MTYSPRDMWTDRRLFSELFRGWRRYAATGETPGAAYQSLISLHCRSNGLVTDALANLVRRFRRPVPLDPRKGVVGALSDSARAAALASLREDGFVVFDAQLPTELCAELRRFAETTAADVEMEGNAATRRAVYNSSAPISRRYHFAEQTLVAQRAVQRLMGDQSLLAFAQAYFDAMPLFDFATMWWSATFSAEPGSGAAQLFHFDFDRIKWLKLFFYLTDVTEERGPHCFVKGSHRRGIASAAPLLSRGYARLTDDDVAAAFGRNRIVSITGKAGTIIAVDTRGFHKGIVPAAGDRLILQFQYAINDFGGDIPRVRFASVVAPELQEVIGSNRPIFGRYLRGEVAK
jgi:phytanoyl-CoA dioxygenase PhyH